MFHQEKGQYLPRLLRLLRLQRWLQRAARERLHFPVPELSADRLLTGARDE